MHAAIALLLASLFALAASAQTKTVLAPAVPDEWLPRLRAEVPQVNLVKLPASEIDSHLADADGFIGKLTPAQLAQAHKLKWEQVMSAGVDDVLFPALVSSDVTVTNMKVVYGPEIADHAFAFLLAMTRRLNVTIPAQKDEKWIRNREGEIELNGKTAVIVGVGGIGRQIAQRAFGFGMKVIGVDIKDYPPDVLVPRYVHPDQLDTYPTPTRPPPKHQLRSHFRGSHDAAGILPARIAPRPATSTISPVIPAFVPLTRALP